MSSFQDFLQLHHQAEPLLIANVWNAQSAKLFEKMKFQALATTSAGVAATLGYSDGEAMNFEEYLFIIKRIKASTSLPLSVDLEGGYGHSPADVVQRLKSLHEAGVVGINIEDSRMEGGARKRTEAIAFTDRLKQIIAGMKSAGIEIFIHVRCDSFLMRSPEARQDAIARLKLYQETGAHGLFMPCITDLEDIKAVVAVAKLPLSVMCMPNLPDFGQLKAAGVKRISMADFVNEACYREAERLAEQVRKEKSFACLFPK